MAMSVMYNAGAQLSLGELNKNINKAGRALAKVSSGMKINSAQDDAASFSISERMRGQIRALLQDNQNVQNGSSMVRTAERGIDQIIQNIRTLKEKAINAANDHNTDEDRATIQKEFDQLVSTIDDIAVGTQFNGKRLLDGTYAGLAKTATSSSTDSDILETPRNVPPLPDGYPFFKTVSEPNQSNSESITGTNYSMTQGGVYTIDSNFTGTITVGTTDAVKFVSADSSQTLRNVQITGPAGGGANIWIENLNITNTNNNSVIKFQGNNNVLSVAGDNTFTSTGSASLINVGDGLNVQSTSNGSITLKNPSSSSGAGIGTDENGTASGDIIISGVNVTANVYDGAAIGSGVSGSVGNIIIENSTMNLSGNFNASIGSGYDHASAGNIIIVHSNITTQAIDTGIGSGYWNSTCGDIEIYNSAVKVTNSDSPAIGAGDERGTCGNILISNSEISCASNHGAAIGSGRNATVRGDITIINESKITHVAKPNGNGDGAVVGTGLNGKVTGKIAISSSCTIDATQAYLDANQMPPYSGIGVGRGGSAQNIGGVEDIKDSYEYVPSSTMNDRETLWLQHGTQANQRINVRINSMKTKDLKGSIPSEADKAQLAALSDTPEKQIELQEILSKANGMTLNDARVTTVDNAKVAIRVVEGALEYALNEATNMGAYLQRLEYTDANVTTMGENVQNSESTIRDADMAKEMTEYTKFNILTQSAQAMLAQANQSSGAVLSLLQ